MNVAHQELAAGRWGELSLSEQLGNVGSEVARASAWRGRDAALAHSAYLRALELLDLTIADPRWKSRLKELTRAREVLCSVFAGAVEYHTSVQDLDRYFLAFAIAARMKRDRRQKFVDNVVIPAKAGIQN